MKQAIREWAEAACWLALACMSIGAVRLVLDADAAVKHLAVSVDGTLRAATHEVNGLEQTEADLHRVLAQATTTLAVAGQTVASANAPIADFGRTVRLVNSPCIPGPCGTLADVNKTLNTARGTLGQVEIAVHHEAGNLDRLDLQEQQLVQDTHDALTGAKGVVTAAHVLLTDPFVPALIEHISTSSASLDHMLSTFDQVETKATTGYLHPSRNPLVRTWHYVSPFALPAAQIAAISAR